MKEQALRINGIPAVIWGESSDRVYVHVHGKCSRKEYAQRFAELAEEKGFQTLSFDLPEHGERANDKTDRCDVWTGVRDLDAVADFAFSKWRSVSLYACSIGAYFSLNAYPDRRFDKCLFQSPLVDMVHMIKLLFSWYGITEEKLRKEREIQTEFETVRWDYYQYALSHPIESWNIPTAILYGAKDNLQPLETIKKFADSHGCALTVSKNSEHPFMAAEDAPIVDEWLIDNI